MTANFHKYIFFNSNYQQFFSNRNYHKCQINLTNYLYKYYCPLTSINFP